MRELDPSSIATRCTTASERPIFSRGGGEVAAALTSTTHPPRLRRAPESSFERCETCESYSQVGYCVKYQLPVRERELCDGFVSIMEKGNRQWAEP